MQIHCVVIFQILSEGLVGYAHYLICICLWCYYRISLQSLSVPGIWPTGGDMIISADWSVIPESEW